MKRIVAVITVLLLGLGTLGFLPEAHAAATTQRAAEAILLKRLNLVRRAFGIVPLTEHNVIRAFARRHSVNMSEKGFLDHRGFATRAERISDRDPGIIGAMCENLALTTNRASARAAAFAIYEAWRDSPVQRGCMFDRRPRRTNTVGIGIVRDGPFWHATYIGAFDRTP